MLNSSSLVEPNCAKPKQIMPLPSTQTRGVRYRFGDGCQNATQDLMRTRGTPGHRHIDRDDIGHATATGVALAEDAARAPAVADRNDQFRVRGRIVGASQCQLHILCDRSRNQQQVCVARAGYESDTQPFNVVKRIIEGMDFQLATIAGPGVNGSNTQRTAKYFKNARLQLVGNTQRVV